MTWPPITREDLRDAASSPGFDTTFPLLIRRLITETSDHVIDLDMPGGSGTAAGGFDGLVTASGQTTFVPEGTSVWELSVGGGQRKANQDYDKRTSGPGGTDTSDLTYVQVILETWTKARAWALDRSAEGRWKRVLAYNLDKVHTWLDSAPATTTWLAEQLGKTVPGVRPADSWWKDIWLPSTHVPLDTGIVLAGREPAAIDLLNRLAAGQRVITLGGNLRVDEAHAFVAATLEQAGTLEVTERKARTLFVSDASSLARLIEQPQSLILVLADAALAADIPIQRPHQLILIGPPGSPGNVDVPPVNGQVVESQLQAAGLPAEQATLLGRLSRRSLLALRRALAVAPETLTPSWASAPDVIRRRLVLAGSWEGTNEQDRRILERFIGSSYADIQEAALVLAAAPETPFLGRVNEQWYVVSPEDAWTLLGAMLTPDDLEAFRPIAMEVISERDPSLNLAEEDQWRAGLDGVTRKFSSALRQALAQRLALLASSDSTLRAGGSVTYSQWVNGVVREILVRANEDRTYHLWMSLSDILSLLAEAAPEAFLRAISDGLTENPPLHTKMFTDNVKKEFGILSPVPHHTAFIRALEVLAWSPDFFDDAINILGRLAALDPGGHWSNRPDRSLAEIFCSFWPNTTAAVDQRIRAMERLLRTQPMVSRRLLIDLIPDGHELQMTHAGPRFRDWKQELPVPRSDMVRVVTAAIDLLLKDLGDVPSRYLRLVEKIDKLSDEHRRIFVERVVTLGESLVNEEERAQLFDSLRAKIAHHREYSDTAWALSETQLQALDAAAEAVRPVDPVRRNAWLFASGWVTLGDVSRREDIHAYDAVVNERRVDAVGMVLAFGGLNAVASLAEGTDNRYLVGTALAQHSGDLDAEMLSWLEKDQEPHRDVAFSYLGQRLRDLGAPLRDKLLTMTNDHLAQARILCATSDPASAWQKLRELPKDVAEHYWKKFTYFGLGSSFAHALPAARFLTDARRYAAALDLLTLYGTQADSADGAQIAVAALEGLIATRLEDPEVSRLNRYGFEQVFALLARHRDIVGRERIMHIEWQLFPALGFDADAPTLHQTLAEEPALFAELVSYAYRRASDDEESSQENVGSDNDHATAKRAYEVLHTWRRCPGIGADGTIDEVLLREWLTEARELLRVDHRLDVGDMQIGHVLAFAPPDEDGLFPPKVVQILLEEIESDRLDTGLEIAIYNKRGVTSRGMLDGGEQEWSLARTYRQRASESLAWPRTKKILNGLAESYESDARRYDDEAERNHRGLIN